MHKNKFRVDKDVFYRRLSFFFFFLFFPLDSSWSFRRTLLASIACNSRGWIISQERSWILTHGIVLPYPSPGKVTVDLFCPLWRVANKSEVSQTSSVHVSPQAAHPLCTLSYSWRWLITVSFSYETALFWNFPQINHDLQTSLHR